MTITQSQQLVFEIDPADPRVDCLVNLLSLHGWLTRRQIMEHLKWPDARIIRSIAEAVPEEIVSGQKGYNTTGRATIDELTHCARQSGSQAKKMLRKEVIWSRLAHERVG